MALIQPWLRVIPGEVFQHDAGSALPGSGHAAATFGHMLFNGGLVALVISFILNIRKDKEDKETKEREAKADKAEAVKARKEAIDAEVHEPAESGSGDSEA